MAVRRADLQNMLWQRLETGCSSPENWLALLRGASQFHKYDFENATLISMQRPDAIACATMAQWNSLHLWIRRGSKAIYVLDSSDNFGAQRVFDISDINAKEESKPVIWRMNPEHKQSIFEPVFQRLETGGAEYEPEVRLFDAMRKLANEIELTDIEIDAKYRGLIADSASCIVLTRCGLSLPDVADAELYADICSVTESRQRLIIGNTAHGLAGSLLRELERESKQYENHLRASTAYKIFIQKELDKNMEIGDNVVDESGQSQSSEDKGGISNESGAEHRDRVSAESGRRLPRPDNLLPGAAERGHRDVRAAETELHESAQTGRLFGDETGRDVEAAPVGYERASDGDGGADNRTTFENQPRSGQGDAPARMGAAHEQLETPSRGDSPQRPNQHVTPQPNIPKEPSSTPGSLISVSHQKANTQTSLFDNDLLVSQDTIDSVLMDGGNEFDSKGRIYGLLNKLSEDDLVDYITSEYGTGGKGIVLNDQQVAVWWNKSGIRIAHGATAFTNLSTLVTWEQAGARIRELFNMGRYTAQTQSDLQRFITQDEIDEVLRRGSNIENSKSRIINSYRTLGTRREFAAFLKSEYGTGGSSQIPPSMYGSSENHSAKGISIYRDYGSNMRVGVDLSWSVVATHIGRLIDDGAYLTESESRHADEKNGVVKGTRLEIDGREFVVDGVNSLTGMVSLRDETFVSKTGYPIFRAEHIDYLRKLIKYKELVTAPPDAVSPEQSDEAKPVPADSHLGASAQEQSDEAKSVPAGSHLGVSVPEQSDEAKSVPAGSLLDVSVPEQSDEAKSVPAGSLLDASAPEQSDEVKSVPAGSYLGVSTPEQSDEAKSVPAGSLSSASTSEQSDEANSVPAGSLSIEFTSEQSDEAKSVPAGSLSSASTPKQSDEANSVPADSLLGVSAPEQSDETKSVPADSLLDVSVPEQSDEAKSVPADSLLSASAPEQPSLPHNYRIHDDNLGAGGARTKADRNVDAIKTLKRIESENRQATPDEQETLAQYVGWGGIPQIFDESNSDWQTRRDTLKGLLTSEEYVLARASTLNAHYTSPTVIRAIYQVLKSAGFTDGNILEPSCGVGNFFGMLPENMRDSKLYGVELDSITGRIATLLYPEANITVRGYETTIFADNFFDVAVGNVPFGSYKLAERRYDKLNLNIHDHFFAKTLDTVRAGGIIAFVTSKGTLDKRDPSVRKYIAQRAELLGAIRLPKTAFLSNAGTSVSTDIIFLQKRDVPIVGDFDVEPDWLQLGQTDDGIPVNRYFVDHSDMMLGRMTHDNRMYGNADNTTCEPFEGAVLSEQLAKAIQNIHAVYEPRQIDEPEQNAERIPADPSTPNYSFVVVNDSIYYRDCDVMERRDMNLAAEQRVRGMIELRDITRELIQAQLAGVSDAEISQLQSKLNERYDVFTAQYGLLSSRANGSLFNMDDGYYLLTSLEILDDERKLERKADMFTKRTISQDKPISHADSAPEALMISISEHACVDFDYMHELTDMDKDKIIADLKGLIFQTPSANPNPYEGWQAADEYLSGDVRQKLAFAKVYALANPRYAENVAALEAVQPKDLEPQEIDVRLGATWIPPKDIDDFVYDLLCTPRFLRYRIKATFSKATCAWNISEKSVDNRNDLVNTTYGTSRMNAYYIIENSLNLRDVRIFDMQLQPDGHEKRVLNQKETILAQQKQAAVRDAFRDWIWRDQERRDRLCRVYNDTYNCIRLREYDGSHLRFVGMNPELKLRQHQKNAVARVLFGGNTLLAHSVGAGKTAVMCASIMEKIRLGLGHKALMVVPNHLTEQTASEFLRFFPAARILVATKRDFETQNRKRFTARIATGDYNAIIIGHSQFEKIPMSKEYQRRSIEEQIDEIADGIEELKLESGQRFSVKELERTRKALEVRLKKLNDDNTKDAVVTFEELGVDMLYVDEAHMYKNLAVITKMRNVAGINTIEAKKSSDMYMKCRYLSERTAREFGDNGRGIVFATGTPVSNSMVELYNMQRYLQHAELTKRGLAHFDSWAANFGETQTAIELAPEGTGYRMKTRFSKFFNLPELMSMFRQVADIQTPDMLNLPIPALKGGQTRNLRTEASQTQHEMVQKLAERAEKVRSGSIDPHQDNMLAITNDGRKLALDARLINPFLPDDPSSKVNACVREVLRIHKESESERLAQILFCDLSIPRAESTTGGFDDVYHDIKRKLVSQGVPESEIAFIHDASTEIQKDEMFAKVRKGVIRVLIGSTAKMGMGTNVRATRF